LPLAVDEIHQGDAQDLLGQVEPESVACSVWSPPYHVGKTYEKDTSYEGWRTLLRNVIRLHYPVLKPGGFLAVNTADILVFPDENMPKLQAMNVRRQRSSVTREDVLAAKAAHPDYSRYQLAELLGCSEQTIDRRMNGNNIRGGKYATQTRVHLVGGMIESAGSEAGLFLYDRRVWHKDPAWQNSKWHTLSYRSVDEFEYIYIFWKPGPTVVNRNKLSTREWTEWGSRGVWRFASVRSNKEHPAKFPIELPRRVIRLLTAPGDLVLDCFMGSGTTAVAAIREGRHYLGMELQPEYVDLARRTCAEEQDNLTLHFDGQSQEVVLDGQSQGTLDI